jgi:hypothetical protein
LKIGCYDSKCRDPIGKQFYSMLDGPMEETGDVSIPDIEANIFKDMLK